MLMREPIYRKQLSAPGLLGEARRCFEQIPDNAANTIPLADHLMSGLALFGFKYPSLLQFDKDRANETIQANLKALYGIERVGWGEERTPTWVSETSVRPGLCWGSLRLPQTTRAEN